MPARYETLAAWANECGWTKGAELGVSDGKTLIYLLEHCPALTMIGVDVWDMPNVPQGATVSGEKCRCQYCAETKADRGKNTVKQREALARAGVARLGRATLYKMSSVGAANLVADGSLDFLFIDGDHSVEGVSADIAAWRPKLKLGGLMCGHDYNMESVRRGVRANYSDRNLVGQTDDHVWWIVP